MVLTNL